MRSSAFSVRAACAALAACAIVCCSAGGGNTDKTAGATGTGTGGSVSSASGTPQGSNGTGGVLGLSSTTGKGGAGGGCQHFDVVFTPETPSVLFVVDASGSSFTGGSWNPLKTAVLNVVQALEAKVRFGLVTYTGIAPAQCPLTTETPIALQNYAAIKTDYDAVSNPNAKTETPTAMALNMVAIPKLIAIADPGPKYMIMVTDGQPDRCDDGDPICPRDEVVAAVQSAYMKGIGTLVLGLVFQADYADHFQALANAGVGAPVLRPTMDDTLNGCLMGNWANAKATYADVGGMAKYYTPDPMNEAALETAVNTAVSGVKSCSFDLQGKIQVDLAHASEGRVFIDGKPVPFDDMNGWYMKSPTDLEVVGAACDELKSAMQGISFDFPCNIIVPK